jgi:hypothetical protein
MAASDGRSPPKAYPPSRPASQRFAVKQGPFVGLVRSFDDRKNLVVPTLERCKDIRHFATINPRLSQPTIFFSDRHKIYECSHRNEVMDKMLARPHPDLVSPFKAEMN